MHRHELQCRTPLGRLRFAGLEGGMREERGQRIDGALLGNVVFFAGNSNRRVDGKVRFAQEAVGRFLALYGAEAGNLALKVLATGGVYLGGGIAPKLAPELVASEFVARFTGKGRMQPLLHDIPVWIVLDDRSGLWGSATYAASRGGVDG